MAQLVLGASDSALIGDSLLLRACHSLDVHPVSFAGAPPFRIAPDTADFQDAYVKSHPAVAAAYRRAQNSQMGQIHPSKMRRA